MTEVGSSFCTGIPGQSDTFATALWAPDQLFTLMSAGVSGVNVEVQTNHPNSSLNYTNGSIIPEPMFYGLALVARTLGPGARLMRVAEQGDTQTLKVWAVRLRDGSLPRALHQQDEAKCVGDARRAVGREWCGDARATDGTEHPLQSTR